MLNYIIDVIYFLFAILFASGLFALNLIFPALILFVVSLFTKDMTTKSKIKKVSLWLVGAPFVILLLALLLFLINFGLAFLT
ncbi:hypothetical protein H7Y21_03620 [Arenimonas sp.]|nr:hypothetical protein [Candidatus Parcubacteria bacterium]